MELIVGVVVLLLSIVIFFTAYRKIRPLYPVSVNCWFCACDVRVPYGNKHCWDCPYCEQYNGFKEDGSYNKPVPAQYTEDINHPIHCLPAEFLTRGEFLCHSCQRNQLLKIKQLAAFEPLNEATYDDEIAFYQRHLEKVYALCPACEKIVQEEVQRVDETLRQHHRQSLLDMSLPADLVSYEDIASTLSGGNAGVGRLCTMSTLLCAGLILCSELCQYVPSETDNWKMCQGLHRCITPLAVCVGGLAGCIISKLCLGKNRLFLYDAVHILVWLAVLLLSMPESEAILLPQQTQDVHLAVTVTLTVLEVVIVLNHRHPTNTTSPVMKRTSLDGSVSSACSESSEAVSSVSTSYRRRVAVGGDCGDSKSTHPIEDSSKTAVSGSKKGTEKVAPASGTGNQTPPLELDMLGKDLSGFSLGKPSSESGYSSASSSSSVFGKSAFTSTPTHGLLSGATFPRPLIAPARLDHIRFSATGRGRENDYQPRSSQALQRLQLSKAYSSSHYNIFLALEHARPSSMFSQQSESQDKKNFDSVRSNTHRDKESFNQSPNFHRQSVRSELWLPKHLLNDKAELLLDRNSQKLGSTKFCWRDSSVVADTADDERWAIGRTERTKEADSMECDSTTPDLTLRTIAQKYVSTWKQPKLSEHSQKFVPCPEVSDDEEEAQRLQTDTSTVNLPAQPKSEFSKWLVVAVVAVGISLLTNLLLVWWVLSS